MLVTDAKVYNISAKISNEERNKIHAFIQGAVYSFCKSNPRISFAARDLFGGINNDWSGTPLQVLYNWHVQNNDKDPEDLAGKDVGWLLLEVIKNDSRTFRKIKDHVNYYEWVYSTDV